MKTQRNMFAAAIAMFSAISAAMSLPYADRGAALGKIGQYKSRGHGKNKQSYANGRGSRGGNNAGFGRPHQGPREMERRRMGGFYNRISLRDTEF